ncbi:MAG: glyoxalase/bleomycin resistance/dioxygenase family protein [Acidobacteria bacterium]|nr:MAG: glyoxalase/bleomycin resistance/dioxygenase family protein [Acidobacteriota bacterium]
MTETKTAAAKAHVAIHVKNLARSLDFYRKLFGIEPVKVRRAYAKFDLAQPPLNFALNESPAGESNASGPATLSHLGIQVSSTEEVLALRERWKRAGLDTRDEMKTECCYAVQDKTWARDPDGNEWEAFVVLEDHLPEKPAEASACCAPTCCAPADAQNAR